MLKSRPWKNLHLIAAAAAIVLLGACQEGGPFGTEAAEGGEETTAAETSAAEVKAPAIPQPARKSPALLAAGTTLRVRTTTTLSTKTVASGETFVGSLEEPLMAGDRLVAAKGATVRGRVVESDPGGRVKGRAQLSIQVTELETRGGPIQVATRSHTVVAEASTKEDAVKVGIGAGIGAAIGAVAGGGSGAAKGAGVGAGAGTGAVLATRGKAAAIPAESVLSFTLGDDVSVELP